MPKKIGSLTLYSVDDLHRQLGLSKMTIRAYLREGKIRARKLGVQWYVTEEALRNYFDEPDPSPASPKPEVRYVVHGVNDLVSEKVNCRSVEETIACIESQAIISLFQVAIINRNNDEVLELITAREFLERYADQVS